MTGDDRREGPGDGAANRAPGAGDMERDREVTSAYRDAIESFAQDVRRAADDELERAREALAEERERTFEETRDLARAVVARARDEAAAERPTGPPWASASLAAVLALGVLGSGWGVVRLVDRVMPGDNPAAGGEPAASTPSSAADAAPVEPDPASDPVADPATLAARFDSLFDARDDRLRQLGLRSGRDDVARRIEAWANGDAGEDRFVHDALVQIALRESGAADLVVDGTILRGPCQGQTCRALIEHWGRRAGDPAYPPMGPNPAADGAALSLVERVVVLRAGGVR